MNPLQELRRRKLFIIQELSRETERSSIQSLRSRETQLIPWSRTEAKHYNGKLIRPVRTRWSPSEHPGEVLQVPPESISKMAKEQCSTTNTLPVAVNHPKKLLQDGLKGVKAEMANTCL